MGLGCSTLTTGHVLVRTADVRQSGLFSSELCCLERPYYKSEQTKIRKHQEVQEHQGGQTNLEFVLLSAWGLQPHPDFTF